MRGVEACRRSGWSSATVRSESVTAARRARCGSGQDELLRSRGGYRSTRLHKAAGPQARFRWINVAELDSVETWQSIVSGPEFGAVAAQMADFHPSPGLYMVEVAESTVRAGT